MTTTAHNTRRTWGGASLARNMEEPEVKSAPHSMYRELYPWMFKDKPKPMTKLARAILDYLTKYGPSTPMEIATGIEWKHVSSVAHCLKSNAHGVTVVGQRKTAKGNVNVWGIA